MLKSLFASVLSLAVAAAPALSFAEYRTVGGRNDAAIYPFDLFMPEGTFPFWVSFGGDSVSGLITAQIVSEDEQQIRSVGTFKDSAQCIGRVQITIAKADRRALIKFYYDGGSNGVACDWAGSTIEPNWMRSRGQ